jgi:hypothetical protein
VSFPGFLNSGTIADRPTHDSKMSVPGLLPAVAEVLDPFNNSTGATLKVTVMTDNESKHILRYQFSPGTF